jgi:AcrR family transcriptional regulator
MTQVTRPRPRGAGKAQLHDSALRLFARDGIEGTSLQAIADDMGVTKAAVYYHYKTKDELVLGVLAPLFEQLQGLIARAAALRTRQARIDEVLTGIVNLAVDNYRRLSMLTGDPYLERLLKGHQGLQEWTQQVVTLIVGPEPDPRTRTAMALFGSGLAGALRDAGLAGLDTDTLRADLIDCGRRLLATRRRPASPSAS